jgi:hypothetical protein
MYVIPSAIYAYGAAKPALNADPSGMCTGLPEKAGPIQLVRLVGEHFGQRPAGASDTATPTRSAGLTYASLALIVAP